SIIAQPLALEIENLVFPDLKCKDRFVIVDEADFQHARLDHMNVLNDLCLLILRCPLPLPAFIWDKGRYHSYKKDCGQPPADPLPIRGCLRRDESTQPAADIA